MSNRAALHGLVDANVLTGGRRTTAVNMRATLDALIDSSLNFDDDADVPNGYLAINSSGLVDISFIKAAVPSGLFLKDDGTWAAAGGGGSQDLESVLTVGKSTGNLPILSPDLKSSLSAIDGYARLTWDDAGLGDNMTSFFQNDINGASAVFTALSGTSSGYSSWGTSGVNSSWLSGTGITASTTRNAAGVDHTWTNGTKTASVLLDPTSSGFSWVNGTISANSYLADSGSFLQWNQGGVSANVSLEPTMANLSYTDSSVSGYVRVKNDMLALNWSDGTRNVVFFGDSSNANYQWSDASVTTAVYLSNTHSSFAWTDGVNGGDVLINDSQLILTHSSKIAFNANNIWFPTLTASTVTYLDASKNLVSSAVTPTELSYVSGATSNLQSQISGLASGVSSYKTACLVATTANITLSGEQTIGGVLTNASRVLVWFQSNPIQNGLYVSGPGAWTRATDFDNNTDKIAGSSVFVQKGTYAENEFICTGDEPIVVGTDPIVFINYGGAYIGTGSRITVVGNQIDISATFEALLGKVASPLSQFASTTSAQLAGIISDETGSGALVFGTSPTFTTDITAPIIYGTASSGGNLTLNSTSHATKGKIFLGASSAYDGANVRLGIGNTAPTVALDVTGAILSSSTIEAVASVTSPLFIGGSAAGSNIVYKSTSGTGTAAAIAHQFTGGTNGASVIGSFYNDYQVVFGSATHAKNGTALGIFRVMQGSAVIDFGDQNSGIAGIWLSQGTNTVSNFAIRGNSSTTVLSSPTTLSLAILGTNKVNMTANAWTVALNNTFTPPASTSTVPVAFLFTGAAHTTLTASSEVIDCNFNLARNVGHNTGAITTQRSFLIQAPAHTFIGASTITDAATFAVSGAPIAGTNATITNAYSIWSQSGTVRVDGTLQVFKTTEQGRVGYDASNYYTETVSSTGVVTFDAVGSGASFAFADNVKLNDVDFVFGTTTGTKVGAAANQKIGKWGATPIVQPTTAIAAATFVANTSGIVNDTATFDGYTIGQLVKALRNSGNLA